MNANVEKKNGRGRNPAVETPPLATAPDHGTASQVEGLAALAAKLRNAVPTAMVDVPAWLCWKRVPKDDGSGKVLKVPYYANGHPRHGTQGTAEDRAALVPLEDALAAMERRKFSGVGFATLEGHGIVALDLDHARESHDAPWKPLVQKLIDKADTYFEVSPSGLGLRAFFSGPPTSNSKNPDIKDGVGLELFGSKGFVTVTGDRINGTDVAPLDDDLRVRLEDLAGRGSAKAGTSPPNSVTDDELRATILSGRDGRRGALLQLSGRLVGRGMAGGDAEAVLYDLLDQCDWRELEPGRWEMRRDEVPGLVAGAVKKYSDPRTKKTAVAAELGGQPPPEPQNLFKTLVPDPLDLTTTLPEVLAEFAEVRAGVAGKDPTMYAYATIGAASGVAPHDAKIQLLPKWSEPLLQWVALVGPSGDGKSPAMNAAVEPVIALHREACEELEEQREDWKACSPNNKGDEPLPVAYYVSDPSIEALIDRVGNGERLTLLHADEGTAWLNSMGRYAAKGGDKGERAWWLSAWNAAPLQVLRVGRGDKFVECWAVAVLYGIVPAKMKEGYGEAATDGMLARTLTCIGNAERTFPRGVDPREGEVTERYCKAVRRLAETSGPITLSPAAADRLFAVIDEYNAAGTALTDLNPGLAGFLKKAGTMTARLAGMYTALEGSRVVDDANAKRAELFMQHATMNARVAHGQIFSLSTPVTVARRVASRILTHGGVRITRRELSRVDAFGKATEADRSAAIEHLGAAGWLLEADTKRLRLGPRFRDATAWLVNPQVYERFADIAERERQAGAAALARLNKLSGRPV